MLKEYTVYILLCSDKTYYVGMTSNLEQRLEQHNNGHFENSYTARRGPVSLQFSACFTNVFEAIEFEKKLKKWSASKKEALINGDIEKIKVLANCRNISHFKNRKV